MFLYTISLIKIKIPFYLPIIKLYYLKKCKGENMDYFDHLPHCDWVIHNIGIRYIQLPYSYISGLPLLRWGILNYAEANILNYAEANILNYAEANILNYAEANILNYAEDNINL